MKTQRRILSFMLLVTLVFTSAFISQAVTNVYANEIQTFNQSVYVQVNGQEIEFEDQRPVIVEGRTLVPVRGVFEFIGFGVEWNAENRQATLTSDDYEVILTIGSAEFTTNGTIYTLDVPAQIINGRTMLPIRAVLESVGHYVSWDSRNRAVLVSSTPITYITIQGEQFSSAITKLTLDEITGEEVLLLAEFTKLRELMVMSDQISDLSALAGLTNLEALHLISRWLEDLSPLSDLTNLKYLSVWSNRILDLTPLERLVNLEALMLIGNEINDLTPIAELTNLIYLVLVHNQIVDIEFLSGLTNLSALVLQANKISDLRALSNLTNLTSLDLSRNLEIRDLAPLAGLVNLNELNLEHNQISNLSPLSGLNRLTGLTLRHNQISDLRPLAELNRLTSLCLANNQISDLSPLANLTNLRFLDLRDNPEITDWSPVENIRGVQGRPHEDI